MQVLKILTQNFHLEKFHSENFCEEENLEFINSSSISKSNLTVKTFHLKVCGSSKREKFFEKLFNVCYEIKQDDVSMTEALQANKVSHSKCFSLGLTPH